MDNNSTENTNNSPISESEKPKRKKNFIKIFFISFSIIIAICISIILFLLYGPWNGFRDWLITTAMNTFHHQYLATWFYSDETIQECLSRNRIIQVTGYTDESLIQFIDYSNRKNIQYKNKYERQILEKDKNNNDYKIIKIDGGAKFSGYMAAIYDPSRVEVISEPNSTPGQCTRQYLTDLSKSSNALVAINGGGFSYVTKDDAIPLGLTISKNRLISDNPYAGIIGFNTRHKLILGNFSSEEAISNNIRDCISFEPYLLMNGQKSQVLGNGGSGTSPRTAIGQRADGIVLFLVLDGNRVLGQGATMQDLIDIFERYGAINAANLDGGNSTTMTVKGKVVNDPITKNGNSDIRLIPSAFILRADDSDDGDYSVVKDKVNK
jgi:exopolysaccharide biosynthesis protein